MSEHMLEEMGVPSWRIRALERGDSPNDHPILYRLGGVGLSLARLRDKDWVGAFQLKNDYGDPAISTYRDSVEGADSILRIIDNQKAGRPLEQGLDELPDSPLGKIGQ